jgi:hypothetical protein
MANAIYEQGDWWYVVDVQEEDDNRKNFHDIYYKGRIVTPKWFGNISPYTIATREQFERAVEELKLKIWLTDGKIGAILNT